VALSQKHRSSIYQSLAPILGEEEVEDLLSQFPARELDEPVTKEFVRAEISGVRAELADFREQLRGEMADMRVDLEGKIAGVRTEVAGLRADLSSDIAGLRADHDGEIGSLRADMHALEARINERLRQQTVWIAGAMAVGMGLAAGIGGLVGAG
jgi:hypothetical protein